MTRHYLHCHPPGPWPLRAGLLGSVGFGGVGGVGSGDMGVGGVGTDRSGCRVGFRSSTLSSRGN